MEVLDSSARPDRAAARAGRAVGLALAVLSLAQVAALAEDRDLSGVRLAVRDGGYTVATPADPSLVSFQLDTESGPVELLDVALSAPGLRLVDVVAAGSATRGRELGLGDADLEPFELGDSVTMSLRFEVTDCAAIDSGRYPLRVSLRDGRRRGTVELPLRDYPDVTGEGGPDSRWQQVLAYASCPSTDPG